MLLVDGPELHPGGAVRTVPTFNGRLRLNSEIQLAVRSSCFTASRTGHAVTTESQS
jgi:hypothetical protein